MTEHTSSAATPSSDIDRLAPGTVTVIALLLVSTFVVILNETIMGVALPRLMEDLDISAGVGQWLTTAFMLTMAVVIPITGFLLQRFPTRPVFIVAMSLFSAGTLICAVAPSFVPLLLGRVVQACGTAIMMPLLMTTVLTLVPESIRGRMMGNISIVISVAPAIGPIISGAILDALSWRWMFIFVLPIAIAALILGIVMMRNVSEPRKLAIDLISVPLAALGFGGIVFGLSGIGEIAGGADPVPVFVVLGIGVVGLVAFTARQRALQRRDSPLLDLRVFELRPFSVTAGLLTLFMMIMFGMLILLPIMLQNVLGFGPMETGLVLLPGGLLMGVLSPLVGRLYDQFGPTWLVTSGAAAVSASLWLLTASGRDGTFWAITAIYLLLSAGLAFIFTPLFTSGLGSLPANLYSHGSAMVGTLQQIGGAAGTATFVTIMTVRQTAAAGAGADAASATYEGIHLAFLCGSVLSLVLIAAAVGFVRRPAVRTVEAAPVA